MKAIVLVTVCVAAGLFYSGQAAAPACDNLLTQFQKTNFTKNATRGLACGQYNNVKSCYLARGNLTEFHARIAMSSADNKLISVNTNFSCANNCEKESPIVLQCQRILFARLNMILHNRTDACLEYDMYSGCLKDRCTYTKGFEEKMASQAIRATHGYFCGGCKERSKRDDCRKKAQKLASDKDFKKDKDCKKYDKVLHCFTDDAKCPTVTAMDEMKQLVDDRVTGDFSCATKCKKYKESLVCRSEIQKILSGVDRNTARKSSFCSGPYERYRKCLNKDKTCSSSNAEKDMELVDKEIKELELGFTCGAGEKAMSIVGTVLMLGIALFYDGS